MRRDVVAPVVVCFQLDFASAQCMNALLDNMIETGQLRAEDRPDQKGFRQFPPPDGTTAAPAAATTPTTAAYDEKYARQAMPLAMLFVNNK